MPRKKVKSESGNCNGKSTSVKTKVEASVSENTRHRDSRKRGPAKDENENSPCKMLKGCDKAGCNSQTPLCHANVLKSCLPQKNTSRWYHISNSEHFCNECFEYYYRSGKAGYQKYSDWKELWKKTADKTEPSFKAFVLDQVLPYWLQCILCKKWRQLPANTEITSDFISKFKCNEKVEGIKKKSNCCNVPEDEIVLEVKEPEWHSSLLWPAYLKNSPAAQFLGAYFPNRVGLSPTCKECIQAKEVYLESRANKRCNSSNEENGIKSDNDYSLLNIPGLHRNLQPFYQPDEPLKAWCIRPDEMEADELAEFPSYEKRAIFYLGTRNLIIALWNLNFKKWLTLQDVSNHLICRGLVRIHCIQLAEKILNFLTRKGSINIGFIKPPNDFTLIPIKKKESVIVVGSGVSGLSAAYQLSRFGFDVTILEGNNRIGGRISDETSMGACVGRGAQIITGVVNNPLILLSEQARLPYRIMKDKCDLYTDKGKIVDYVMDQKIDQHFNSTLEDIAIWKKDKEVDVPLYEKLMELSRLKCKENNETFNDEERQLFDFYVANLEYACGSVLKNLSTLHWDQNEAFPQFAGQHALLPNGYSAIFFKIAENLNVKLNTTVINIDYSKDKIKVETNEGDFFADKVIVTISLALMQTNCINFKPPLPDKKIYAIDSLGSGLIEKIAVQFSRRFWDKNLIDADMFGYIPVKPHEKGLFGVIYDMTPQNRDKENGPHILMTCATSDAVNFVHNKPPLETVRYFLKVLRRIFPDEDVPDPIDYFVTNWGDDTNFHMAYSYVKIGGSGESYDGLAEAVDDKLFFAGEATNRQFPQTVTGAFISGLREANKITSSVLKVKN